MGSQVRLSRQKKNNKTCALCQPIMFLTSVAQIKNILDLQSLQNSIRNVKISRWLLREKQRKLSVRILEPQGEKKPETGPTDFIGIDAKKICDPHYFPFIRIKTLGSQIP